MKMGDLTFLENLPPFVLGFLRKTAEKSALCLFNLSQEKTNILLQSLNINNYKIAFEHGAEIKEDGIMLLPYALAYIEIPDPQSYF